MFTIEQLKQMFPPDESYRDEDDGPDDMGWHEVSDYGRIIDAVATRALDFAAGNYSGDSFLLLQENETGRYGYLTYGWGSCGGCDALMSIRKWSALKEFADQFVASIRWFDTPEEAIDFFRNHDWEGDWTWSIYEEEIPVFVEQAIGYITSRLNK